MKHALASDKVMTMAEVAELVSGQLVADAGDVRITALATIDAADAGSVCFASKAQMLAGLAGKAGAVCLIPKTLADDAPKGHDYIVVDNPKDRFTQLLAHCFPPPSTTGKISTMADVAPDAKIGKDVQIDSFAQVKSGAVIGDNSIIHAGVVIGEDVIIGHHARIMPNVSISHAEIGNYAQISSGVVIGNSGFGISTDGANRLAPHIGKVRIGDHCYFGANTSIDRGMLDDTIIGNHVMLDSLCHIAHNAVIGDGTIFCAMSGVAGSVRVGKRNLFGAQVGVVDHIVIGDNNIFAGCSGVTKSLGDNQAYGGVPAVPMADYRLQVAGLRQLARKMKRKEQ